MGEIGGLSPGILHTQSNPSPSRMIGIVGAGITGLTLSSYLEERGEEHLVLEATERPGGVIRTTEVEGRILDHGPQRTRVTPEISLQLEQLGLESELITVPPDHPLFVCRGGELRLVPFTPAGLFRTNLLSWPGKLRVFLEPLTARWMEDETVGAFLTRKFGAEAYENLMGPLFGGLYGSDPGEMYVRHSLAGTMEGLGVSRSILWRFLQGSFNRSSAPAAISFRGGMETWIRALHESVKDRVRLSTPVEALEPGSDGRGWRLLLGDDSLEVDELVFTLPADAASELLLPVAPELGARLRMLRYNSLALVHLAGETGLHGLGYQVSYGENLRTRGVTWNASALARNGVYTAFLGGARDPGLLELSDQEIGEIARREFGQVTGAETRVLSVSRTRVPSWDRSWTVLEGIRVPRGIHLCSNYESRVGIPGRISRARAMAEELASPE